MYSRAHRTSDHLSRLVKRAATIGTTTTTAAHYLHDGWNHIAESNGTGLAKVFPRGLALSGTPHRVRAASAGCFHP